MKAIKLFLFVSFIFLLQGCYTIIWTPDLELPTKDTSERSDSYYDPDDYGNYYPYYEIPWWYSIPPATYTPPVKPRGPLVEKVRNTGNTDRTTEPPARPERPPIADPGTPTVSQPPTTEDTSTKRTTESTPPKRERESGSSNSRDTRNNDGNRSTDPPRR